MQLNQKIPIFDINDRNNRIIIIMQTIFIKQN